METAGLVFDTYWQGKSLLIDHKLLKTRNEVAHGDLVVIDVPLYEELHAFVIEGLNWLKTAVENAAATGQHRASRETVGGPITLNLVRPAFGPAAELPTFSPARRRHGTCCLRLGSPNIIRRNRRAAPASARATSHTA